MAESDKIEKFDCTNNLQNLGPKWKRWLSSFKLFSDSKGLIIEPGRDNNKQRRRALLLHSAGIDVQEIFATLDDTGCPKDYVECVNNYFSPKMNTAHARHEFLQCVPKPDESVIQFVVRLKTVVKDCEYGGDSNNQNRRLCVLANTKLLL